MAKYSSVSVSGYNASPPPDDGTAVSTNVIKWSNHKTKLGDPLKTALESINTNLATAFGRTFADSSSAKTANFTVGASDQGKTFICTNTINATLPSCATVGDGFVVTIKNNGSGTVALIRDGTDTIDGAATYSLDNNDDSVVIMSDGSSNWVVLARVLGSVGVLPRSYIAGLRMSNNVSDSDHDIDIAVGECRDYADAEDMVLSSALTKRIDASWAQGTNQGGFPTALTIANDTLYYVFIVNDSSANIDAGFDTSATATNLLSDTGGDAYRLIGFVRTNGSANIYAFSQSGDYFRYTGDVLSDVADSTITADTFETAALSVPPNSLAHIYAQASFTSGTSHPTHLYIRTNGAADASGDSSEAFLSAGVFSGTHQVTGSGFVLVDGSSQIQYTCNEPANAATVNVKTFGCLLLTRSDPI